MPYERPDRGPLDTYEVIWNSGRIEYIEAHQVMAPTSLMYGDLFGIGVSSKTHTRWMFHGEVNGDWKLLLFASADDIKSVRNVSHTRDNAELAGP